MTDRWIALALFVIALVVLVYEIAGGHDWIYPAREPRDTGRGWLLPMPLGLVQIDADDDAILVTPRGVEIDLRDSDLELSDVLEHVQTIEAL